jgi:hypothetical protein
MKFETADAKRLLVLDPRAFNSRLVVELNSRFQQVAMRPMQAIKDEIGQPDRRALDEVVFEVLGLTAGEREAVYEAVVALVRARLEKSQST